MRLSVMVHVIGTTKVRKAFEQKTKEVERVIELALDESALNVQTDAKIDAPKDLGAAVRIPSHHNTKKSCGSGSLFRA